MDPDLIMKDPRPDLQDRQSFRELGLSSPFNQNLGDKMGSMLVLDFISLEAEGKGTKASEGKCGNVKRGVVVTGLFLWSIYSKTCSDILHKAVSYRY